MKADTQSKVAEQIENNSAVEFVADTPDGLQGRLAWHSTDELLGVHQAASKVGRTVTVRYEDDDGNVSLAFPEK